VSDYLRNDFLFILPFRPNPIPTNMERKQNTIPNPINPKSNKDIPKAFLLKIAGIVDVTLNIMA
jgi:hypothetical protein